MSNVSNVKFLYENKLHDTKQELSELNKRKLDAEKEHKTLLEVRGFFSSYLDVMTVERITVIEETVNYGLLFVFGYPITIKIQKQYKNNKTFFNMVINHGEISGSAESYGGSVVAIVAFLFKFVILTKFKFMKFIVLDESLNFVSWHFQERVSMLLRELAEKFDVDIMLISHQPLLNTRAHFIHSLDKKNDCLILKETTVSDFDKD